MRLLALLLLLPAVAAQEARGGAWRLLGPDQGLPAGLVHDICASGTSIWVAADAGLFELSGLTATRRAPEPATEVGPAPAGGVYARIGSLVYRFRSGAGDREAIEEPTGAFDRAPPGFENLPPSLTRFAVAGGALYAASDDGVMVRSATGNFRRVPAGGAKRIHALALDAERTLWCATDDGLVKVRADGATESIHEVGGEKLGVVTAVGIDSEGALWIGSGSSFRGAWRLRKGEWERVRGLDGFVHRISRDNAGVLWFATLDSGATAGFGAWFYRDGRFVSATGSAALPSMRVYDVVARDPSGVLWFATLKGLAAFRGDDRMTLYQDLPGGKVFCLLAARNGALWTGYQKGHGTSRLAGGSWTHFDKGNGLCDERVWSILEGRPGVTWFATADGLARYDGVRWSCLRGAGAPLWPLLLDGNDAIWVGTLGNGLFRFGLEDQDAPLVTDVGSTVDGNALRVTWRAEDVRFACLPAELRYRYRVDGGRWSDVVAASGARIPASSKMVEVQAIDPFGNASPPASLTPEAPFEKGYPWVLWLAIIVGLVVAIGSTLRGRTATNA